MLDDDRERPVAVLGRQPSSSDEFLSANWRSVSPGYFAAMGVPHFVKADMVKPGAVVVDVGMNRVEDADAARDLLPGADYDVPTVQRGGIGQRLLDTLEAFARDAGFKKLYLYTTFVLPGAKRLYEKNGFYVLRETAPEEWCDMGGLEMEKILS